MSKPRCSHTKARMSHPSTIGESGSARDDDPRLLSVCNTQKVLPANGESRWTSRSAPAALFANRGDASHPQAMNCAHAVHAPNVWAATFRRAICDGNMQQFSCR